MRTLNRGGRNIRQITALAIATTFLTQNFAWAVCSDGTSFPPGNQGFVFGNLNTVAPSLANMSTGIFTATAGSVFIPDNSTFENNDPSNVSTVALNGSGITGLPTTLASGLPIGGHNWVMDQGSTTCKETSTVTNNAIDATHPTGGATPAVIPGQAPTGWSIPPNTTTDCFVLPVVKFQTVTTTVNTGNGQVKTTTSTGSACNGIPGTVTNGNPPIITTITCSVTFSNFGVVPLQSQAIVTPCDPTLLPTAPLTPVPGNSLLNQLGCSISQMDRGVITARDQTTAPAYMATASIMGGLFLQRLDNVNPPNAIGDSGRQISELKYMADTAGIPAGTKLTNAIVSPDGHFVLATSIRRDARVFGCNMPLGNPGRIDSPPVSLAQFALSTDTIGTLTTGVKCMSNIGTTGLSVTLSNVWGADNQPYMGGQRTITTAGTTGGNPGSALSSSSWPTCIINGKGEPFTLPAVLPNPLTEALEASVLGVALPGAKAQVDTALFNNVAQLDASIADVFTRHLGGNCLWGPNSGFSASPVIQPQTMATYTASNGNMYMFTAGVGQPTVQTRMTQDAINATHYTTRTYFSGENGITTGVGVAPDMNFAGPGQVNTLGQPPVGATNSGSLIVMVDSTGLGLAGQENMTRLPLCEDF
jgi:hypothetical protein